MDYEKLSRQMLSLMPKLSKPNIEHVSKFGKGEFVILGQLKRAGGSLTAGEIAKMTCVSNARTTAAIDSLEKKGYVIRKPVEGDRRKIRIMLSDKGEGIIEEHFLEGVKRMADYLEYLGEDHSNALMHIMEKSIQYFEGKEM